MSDRLNELRRQRALVQAQADWLDREIAACGDAKPAPDATPAVAPVAAAANRPSLPVHAVTPEEQIYTPDPIGASQRAKRGCFLYFVLILALLGATLLVFYFTHYRDRPLIFMEKDGEASSTATGQQ